MDSVFHAGWRLGALLAFHLVPAMAQAQPLEPPPPSNAPPVPDGSALVSPTATEAAPQPQPEAPTPALPAAEPLAPGQAEGEASLRPDEGLGRGTGFYAEVSLGVGGPFGGNTTDRLSQGLGATVAAGYAFHPNFGVNLFGHYNRVHVALRRSDDQPDTNEGSVRLFGMEVRGFLGNDGPVRAWGSLGAAFGSGEIRYGDSVDGVRLEVDGTVDFAFMPVMAFGAEARLGSGFRLGPQVRWYLTGVEQACIAETCTADTSNEIAPDILYLGLTLSYSQQ